MRQNGCHGVQNYHHVIIKTKINRFYLFNIGKTLTQTLSKYKTYFNYESVTFETFITTE